MRASWLLPATLPFGVSAGTCGEGIGTRRNHLPNHEAIRRLDAPGSTHRTRRHLLRVISFSVVRSAQDHVTAAPVCAAFGYFTIDVGARFTEKGVNEWIGS